MSRLTIQYTIEMEEIEGEVNRLIHKAISLLGEIAEKEPPTDKMLSYVALDHLDEIRKNLNKIDHNLNDATNIICLPSGVSDNTCHLGVKPVGPINCATPLIAVKTLA